MFPCSNAWARIFLQQKGWGGWLLQRIQVNDTLGYVATLSREDYCPSFSVDLQKRRKVPFSRQLWFGGRVSKVVSTHLWNTPLNLYQQDMKGFLSWLTRGFAWGVLYGCVVMFLEFSGSLGWIRRCLAESFFQFWNPPSSTHLQKTLSGTTVNYTIRGFDGKLGVEFVSNWP